MRKTRQPKELPRPRSKMSGESVQEYVTYIEKWLAGVDLHVLQQMCRKYGVSIEGLVVAIAADKTGKKREVVQSECEAQS